MLATAGPAGNGRGSTKKLSWVRASRKRWGIRGVGKGNGKRVRGMIRKRSRSSSVGSSTLFLMFRNREQRYTLSKDSLHWQRPETLCNRLPPCLLFQSTNHRLLPGPIREVHKTGRILRHLQTHRSHTQKCERRCLANIVGLWSFPFVARDRI